MSGALPINIGQGAVRSIYRNSCPTPIAPVTVQSILWTNATGSAGGLVSFNFQSIIPQSIAGIQGAFIDNSSCVLPITITDTIGNQFVIPAGWQAMIPIAYTQGGTVTAQIPAAIQEILSVTPQPGAMTTNIEFYNEQVENVGMWPVAKPFGVYTSGSAEWLGAFSENTFDTTMTVQLTETTQNEASFPQTDFTPLIVEEILGGGIFPGAAHTQGTTGWFGGAILFMQASSTVPVLNEGGGFCVPITIQPSEPVGCFQIYPAKYRMIHDPAGALGLGDISICGTASQIYGGDTGLFPAMTAIVNVRARFAL